jgi:hypothetical protein
LIMGNIATYAAAIGSLLTTSYVDTTSNTTKLSQINGATHKLKNNGYAAVPPFTRKLRSGAWERAKVKQMTSQREDVPTLALYK